MLLDILIIIRLNSEIILEILKDLTPQQKQDLWKRHEERMQFWQNLADTFKDK